MNRIFQIVIVGVLCLHGCQKRIIAEVDAEDPALKISVNEAQSSFAKILSKAAKTDQNVRVFIQQKALEQFDNDYDVFYPMVKDDLLSNGKSFREVLLNYTTEDSLSAIEQSLPLLNIYVPELPSGFNAESWNATEEVPIIAIRVDNVNSVPLFYDGSFVDSLSGEVIPGFPTLVVKNNERLKLQGGIKVKGGKQQYAFIDDAFDHSKNDPSTKSITDLNQNINAIPEVVSAFNTFGINNNLWQRDHIYYNLSTDPNSRGELNRRVIETLYALKFSPDAIHIMSDQTGDPFLQSEFKYRENSNEDKTFHWHRFWTEGRYEIHLEILIGNLYGYGTTITRYISIPAHELFQIAYSKQRVVERHWLPYGTHYAWTDIPFSVYKVTGVAPLIYRPRIKLVPWDIQNFSFGWKFIVSERDDTESTVREESYSSEFATNFGISFGKNEKFGLNFGSSTKETKTSRFSITTTRNSDPLGTVEMDFSKPVILKQGLMAVSDLYSADNGLVSITLLPAYDY